MTLRRLFELFKMGWNFTQYSCNFNPPMTLYWLFHPKKTFKQWNHIFIYSINPLYSIPFSWPFPNTNLTHIQWIKFQKQPFQQGLYLLLRLRIRNFHFDQTNRAMHRHLKRRIISSCCSSNLNSSLHLRSGSEVLRWHNLIQLFPQISIYKNQKNLSSLNTTQ